MMSRASALAALLTAAVSAHAQSPTAQWLGQTCGAYLHDAAGAEGRACAAYVWGVIDGRTAGLQAADARGSPESFSERAARTRGAQPRPRSRQPSCPPPALDEVVAAVIASLDASPPGTGDSAADAVIAALPSCPAPDSPVAAPPPMRR